MRLYLSSFRLGNGVARLEELLCGEKRTALILNARDYKTPEERAISLEREMTELESIGIVPDEIDLRRYFDNPTQLRDDLSMYDLLYVPGGNTFVLRRAFRQSGADEIVRDMLVEDRVVFAGYSAGPCLLGPTLHGIEVHGDSPHDVPRGYDPAIIWEGLDILPFVFAPHYRSEHPEAEGAVHAIEYYIENHIPFIALRDGEVLVVEGARQEVVGSPNRGVSGWA